MKDERGENLIFYDAKTITCRSSDLRSLLREVTK
jgi:hypothetical protein